ncbi:MULTISPECIES: hypothetical protein [unclassified Brachybacterium]|uniref:hypothetical protein n=1 Tax=unclassified Brachybacterium TaxID=2623841 RepID=UPI003612F4D7
MDRDSLTTFIASTIAGPSGRHDASDFDLDAIADDLQQLAESKNLDSVEDLRTADFWAAVEKHRHQS